MKNILLEYNFFQKHVQCKSSISPNLIELSSLSSIFHKLVWFLILKNYYYKATRNSFLKIY